MSEQVTEKRTRALKPNWRTEHRAETAAQVAPLAGRLDTVEAKVEALTLISDARAEWGDRLKLLDDDACAIARSVGALSKRVADLERRARRNDWAYLTLSFGVLMLAIAVWIGGRA